MRLTRLLFRAAPLLNVPVAAMTRSPRLGRLVGGTFAMVSYTGRKSGKTISLPVGYRRHGDDIVINVVMPEAKTWWRNFLGDGAPLTITLDGRDRTGHAVARRDANGRVTVEVTLTP
ncbi:MAG TPA: nitroreductase/quinone reductase family protein [Mycobacterium sp.]|nr:nitroreductase/quinone reductase family protein [Mycobacterium sp.]